MPVHSAVPSIAHQLFCITAICTGVALPANWLQEYYDFLQSYSHPGPDLMHLISTLPTPLSIEMARELYSPTLAKIPLFNGVQPVFLESLARGLLLYVFLAGATANPAIFICSSVKRRMAFTKCNFPPPHSTVRYTACSQSCLLHRGANLPRWRCI